MKICKNCFSDKELKAFISLSETIGDCEVCSSKNVNLIDLEELLDFFQELLDNFQPHSTGESLKSKIQGKWSFFSSLGIATKILNKVLPKLSTEILNSDSNVDYIDEINENIKYWETLKEELKWNRRFLTNTNLLEDLGWDSFFNTQFVLQSTDKMYRARVHHKAESPTYNQNEMMCPSKETVGGGRANPLGIPYLYLCDNPETVLYEVRASFLDELSVGIFKLKDSEVKTKIVDFTEDTSLFRITKVNEIIKASLLRDKISKDLSKPMRRYDTEIEYIPTQFICEFIKVYTGSSGIRFRSSLHPSGNNIVIFDQDKIECVDVKLEKITSLKLKSNTMTNI